MKYEFDKAPEEIRQVILHTTPVESWQRLVHLIIQDKEAELARLNTHCPAEEFLRKYNNLRSSVLQLEAFDDLLTHIENLRIEGNQHEVS